MDTASNPLCPHCRHHVRQLNAAKSQSRETLGAECTPSEWHCETCGKDFAPDYFEWAPYYRP